jgi:hypothetical protein
VFTTETDTVPIAEVMLPPPPRTTETLDVGVCPFPDGTTTEDDSGLLFPPTKTNAHKSVLSGVGVGVCVPRLT